MKCKIKGYAAIFNEVDLNGDIILPQAFDLVPNRATLSSSSVENKIFNKKIIPADQPNVKMLYQHKIDQPIGLWQKIEKDAYGLYVEGEINTENSTAEDVCHLIETGVIDGLSIGFNVVQSYMEGAHRVITDIDLWEISIVTFPMAEKARITQFEKIPTIDQLLEQTDLINQELIAATQI